MKPIERKLAIRPEDIRHLYHTACEVTDDIPPHRFQPLDDCLSINEEIKFKDGTSGGKYMSGFWLLFTDSFLEAKAINQVFGEMSSSICTDEAGFSRFAVAVRPEDYWDMIDY